MPTTAAALDQVLEYHQRTKHDFKRYAAGPGELDWSSQPEAFRMFAGSTRLALPLLGEAPQPHYRELYQTALIPRRSLSLPSLAAMLELSLGISAWKQYAGKRWALRCNPSSGNLHPTEAYVVLTACSGIADGLHHYCSRDHVLEQRCQFPADSPAVASALPPGTFLLGLSSIHWREAWKYGERAYRYCQHDVGHAIAALRYAAALFGWQVQLLTSWSDDDIGSLLGIGRDQDFDPAEREHPDLLLQVETDPRSGEDGADGAIEPGPLLDAIQGAPWQGRANRLSARHLHDWPVIDAVAQACRKPREAAVRWIPAPLPAALDSPCGQSAASIIRQRRSAQAFDGATSITAATFYRMLDMTLAREGVPPWDMLTWPPRVHLLLFVHRVDGLMPGLYLFMRNATAGEAMRQAMSKEFTWVPVTDCPAHFQLFRLDGANLQRVARTLSCHQDIAADGAFSLGMLAEYESTLAAGPWRYRQLFWEAGMLGQVLYLEAEAAGVRGTGIGCYFDDGVHEMLGLQARAVQSMYHFTLGGALTDDRLQTLPAYGQ